ncbi:hypothetical protein FEM03_13580 [Phragmitibacter flavus]|uniref:Uncharacterized protein n=1 Tax=Phragmitibacter flavus TaxID=2576071 RepID=A0A5R8KD22_9BACT|nr:hypothetical protein [Phragmitibacter flavus]TLD70214.1 hypothetical protein FEM03_13580 [Phragmitibacter flavus]
MSTVETQVFINCPFDDEYRPLFHATVFSVVLCGYTPRCALEAQDSGEVRLNKIIRLIRTCRYGIHDISRTELDQVNSLPRFNMPFELGLFLGAAGFGDAKQKRKVTLIFDSKRYRYQKFISDIAGQDIKDHDCNPHHVIKKIRDWLSSSQPNIALPGGRKLIERYENFHSTLPAMLSSLELDEGEISFVDFCRLIQAWLVAE